MKIFFIGLKNIFFTFLKCLLVASFIIAVVVLMAFYYNQGKFYPILFIAIISISVGYFVPKILRKKFGNTLDKIDRFNYMREMGTIYTYKNENGLYPYRKYLFTFNRFKELKSKIYYVDEKTRKRINFLDLFVTFFGIFCLLLISKRQYSSDFSLIMETSLLILILCIFLFLISRFLRNFIIEKYCEKDRYSEEK